MFCSREKSIGLKVIQQNEKSTQVYKQKLCIRGLVVIVVMGEMCNQGARKIIERSEKQLRQDRVSCINKTTVNTINNSRSRLASNRSRQVQ